MSINNIFKNPLVYKPPAGDLTSPVYRDARGEIHRLNIGGFKVNMLYSKAGVLRSGDLHKNTQFSFVFSGRIRIWYWQNGKVSVVDYGPNAFIEIKPGVPHLYEYLADTVNVEWWSGPFEVWFFKPFRDVVEGRVSLDAMVQELGG